MALEKRGRRCRGNLRRARRSEGRSAMNALSQPAVCLVGRLVRLNPLIEIP
jgi:hypothetical protein